MDFSKIYEFGLQILKAQPIGPTRIFEPKIDRTEFLLPSISFFGFAFLIGRFGPKSIDFQTEQFSKITDRTDRMHRPTSNTPFHQNCKSSNHYHLHQYNYQELVPLSSSLINDNF